MDNLTLSEYFTFYLTLHKASFNREKTSWVTNSSVTAIDFDEESKIYSEKKHKCKRLASADSLYFDKTGEIFFIEFKSGKKDNIKGNDIKLKAIESMLTFMDMTSSNWHFILENVSFVVAYGDISTKSVDEINRKLSGLGGVHIVEFSLERFKGTLFKNVITLNCDDFEQYIQQNNWTSMESGIVI